METSLRVVHSGIVIISVLPHLALCGGLLFEAIRYMPHEGGPQRREDLVWINTVMALAVLSAGVLLLLVSTYLRSLWS